MSDMKHPINPKSPFKNREASVTMLWPWNAILQSLCANIALFSLAHYSIPLTCACVYGSSNTSVDTLTLA